MESSGRMRHRTGALLGFAAVLIVVGAWVWGCDRRGGGEDASNAAIARKTTKELKTSLATAVPETHEDAQSDCGHTGLYLASECDWTMADNPPWCREIDCGPQPNGLIGTIPGDASDDCIVIIREHQPIAVDASCNPEHIVYPRVIRTEPTWILLHQDGGANCRCEPLDVTVTRTRILSHSRETSDQAQIGMGGQLLDLPSNAPTGIGKLSVDSPFGKVEISEPSNVERVTEFTATAVVTESTTISPCRTWRYKKYKQRVGIYRDVREVNTLYACSANGCYWVALVCPAEPVMTDESEWLPEDGHYPVDAGFGQYPNCPGGRSCSDGEGGACDTP